MVFVSVLGTSNHTFVDVTWSRALPDWTISHVRMFECWGGGARARYPGQTRRPRSVRPAATSRTRTRPTRNWPPLRNHRAAGSRENGKANVR